MTCDDVVTHLAGSPMASPGATPTPLPAPVAAYLASCEPCAAVAADLARLAVLTSRLAPELPPARDLWPAVVERLAAADRLPSSTTQRRRRRVEGWRLAAAAAILVVTASAIALLWQRATPPRVAQGTPTPAVSATFVPAAQTVAQAYGPLDSELLALYHRHADRLSPATREVIARNLAVIDTAMADIRAALAADPASPSLIRDLDQLHRQRLDLLTGAAALGARL